MSTPAEVLFGGDTKEPQWLTPQPQRAAMFGDEQDAAEKLFGASVHADTTLHTAPDVTQSVEAFKAANDAWRGSLRTLSLSGTEGREITDLLHRYGDTPADAATRDQWDRQTSENLERRYGPHEARERFAAATALAKRSSLFMKEINEAGLGSHPRIVELLADRAHSLRLAGKL